jgi:uncharacterized protein (DUF58 family)
MASAEATARPVARGRRRRRTRRDEWRAALDRRWSVVSGRLAPVTGPLNDYVSPAGWFVLASAVLSLVLGLALHWGEFVLVGYLLLAVLAACVVLTLGRVQLAVTVGLHPYRVRAGDTAAGRVDVLNLRRRRLLPLTLELPVGRAAGRFNLPALRPGAALTEHFTVPTLRRGVIPVGPVTTVRGDPFGLLRRTVRWTDQLELFVHPWLVAIDPLDSGLLRDLEGRTTNDMSVSDLAFHALRQYAPGDDRRYIHWRSSARHTAISGDTHFLVRQFLDTRRSHLCVIVDCDELAYTDDDEFETAIAAAASVAVRAIRDEIRTTVVVGDHVVAEGTPARTLDGFARAQQQRVGLARTAADAARAAPAASIALFVTGAQADYAEVRRAAANFSIDVATVVLRVDPTQRVGISAAAGTTLLTMGELADLPRLMRSEVRR